MKQRYWIVIVSILILMSSSEDVFAQRNKTKCPPGKSFFKADKKARKRAGEGKNHPRPKVFYQPQRIEEEKTVKSRSKAKAEKNANWYVDSKKQNRRIKKVDTKSVASTKCPR